MTSPTSQEITLVVDAAKLREAFEPILEEMRNLAAQVRSTQLNGTIEEQVAAFREGVKALRAALRRSAANIAALRKEMDQVSRDLFSLAREARRPR